MDPAQRWHLGTANVDVTQIGFGGVPLGEPFVQVDERQASVTLDAAWTSGMRYSTQRRSTVVG